MFLCHQLNFYHNFVRPKNLQELNPLILLCLCNCKLRNFFLKLNFVKTLYNITKSIDNTRIFIDCSGWTHVDGVCDMLDCHTYEQDPEKLNANITDPMGKDAFGVPYTDKLCFVSEFGGTSYWENRSEDDAWGYGNAPKTMEEFMQRLEGLVSVLLKNENLCAFCYTQLTDVEQEQNGLYTYTRKAKFDLKAIKSIISAKAACEE